MSFLRRQLRPIVPGAPASPAVPATPSLRRAPGRPGSEPSHAEREPTEQAVTESSAQGLEGLRLLVVCTANISRSPLGEGLLQELLPEAIVTSAGIRAAHHLDIDPRSLRYAAGRGIDLSAHRPRQLERNVLATDGADLVLVMTREHVRELANIELSATKRTFTFKEFVRRSQRAEFGDGSVGSFVQALSSERSSRDLLGDDPRDDVADPYGRSETTFMNVAAELETLCEQIAHTLTLIAGNAR